MSEREVGLTEEGRARRRFLKQAGAVAWGAPLIVTMMSRAAHAQTTCGTQILIGAGPAIGCNQTSACGSLQACVPDATDPGIGNACLCESVPNPT